MSCFDRLLSLLYVAVGQKWVGRSIKTVRKKVNGMDMSKKVGGGKKKGVGEGKQNEGSQPLKDRKKKKRKSYL